MQGASIFHLARGLHRREFFTTRDIARRRLEAGLLPGASASRTPSTSPRRASSALSLHRRPHRRRARGARRGDLRRGDGPPDLAGHPRAGPAAPRPGPAGLAGHRRARSRSPQIIARRLGLTGALGTVAEHVDGVYTGRLVGDMLHGPAKAEAVKALAAREGARPEPLLGVLRLLQRPADALAGRRPVRDQPGRPAARARPRAGLADPRLPHRPQGGPRRAARGRRRRAPSPVPSPRGSRCAVGAADSDAAAGVGPTSPVWLDTYRSVVPMVVTCASTVRYGVRG